MLLILMGCTRAVPDSSSEPVHPTLMVQDPMREGILERIEREPLAGVLVQVTERADQDYRETSLEGWDPSDHGHNAGVSQANAFLAWLYQDPQRAVRAIEGFQHLDDDWSDNDNWDINIRMPYALMGYTNAHDLLLGTPWYPLDEQERLEGLLTSINEQFFDTYVRDDTMRQLALGFSQNNHPIRTASAIGYVALGFPEHPDAQEWLDFAVEENAYLWGPEGHYVQPDGGISEGPLYYHFGMPAALAFFIAVENSTDIADLYTKSCLNRQDVDPWLDHGCVEGQTFTFDNPLGAQGFADAFTWSVALRLPWGPRPPLADARFDSANGGPVLQHWAPGIPATFDWLTNLEDPEKTTGGMELGPYHLAYMDPDASAEPPEWTTRFMPQAGNAVFRSGWDSQALWLLLVAENGDARKTLHDHVDGSSFTLAAYGEYLLMDPGYYKPNELNNAVTAQGDAHNLILVDGQGPPDKGLLQSFGDTDAFLENTLESEQLDYAEAWISYEDTAFERSVLMVRDRWFAVVDRLDSQASERTFTWRVNGYAGTEETGGRFALTEDGAVWERTRAGVFVHVASPEGPLSYEAPERQDFQRPYVHELDTVGHHSVLDASISATSPDFLAVLAPYEVGGLPLEVQPVEGLTRGVAWRVEDDLIWLTAGASTLEIDGLTLETDAEVVFYGLTDGLALIARGSGLSVDGAEVDALRPD
jgi:hypothetical protein